MRPSLHGLPPELVAEILYYLPQAQIIGLATTSRTFNACCSRLVYKGIKLEGLDEVKKCCETLAFNSVVSSYVRTLRLTIGSQEAPKSAFTARFNRLLHSAFKNVSNALVSLDLDLPKDNVTSCLKRLSFPQLRTLNVASALNPDLAHFLLAHHKLEALRIVGAMALPTNPRGSKGVHTAMSIPMTSLKAFAGPPGSCSLILPGSQVHDILLNSSGSQNGPDWEQDFVDSVLESKRPIKVLGFANFMYRSVLFDVIGQRLGNISRLSLGLTEPDQVHTVLDGLLSVLPHLNNLYHLRLNPSITVDPQGIDDDTLDTDYLFISKVTACQESVSVCDLISTVTWARLVDSGQWLPLFPTPVGVHWWFQCTPLAQHIQRRVVTHIANFDEEMDDLDDDEDFDFEPKVHKLATAIGFMLNRAFGLARKEDEDSDTDEEYDDDDGSGEHERLRVPVRDHRGDVIEPYSERSMARWDTFVSIIGFTTLHPIPVFLQNMTLFELFLPPVQTPLPVLDEGQKELMKIVLDILYNSFHGKQGILFKNYFRNPDGCWGEKNMTLGIAFQDSIIPIGSLGF